MNQEAGTNDPSPPLPTQKSVAVIPPGQSTVLAGQTSEAGKAATLSPEEQMALYEKELKENDWGHQPC